jgi:hypothetical protein
MLALGRLVRAQELGIDDAIEKPPRRVRGVRSLSIFGEKAWFRYPRARTDLGQHSQRALAIPARKLKQVQAPLEFSVHLLSDRHVQHRVRHWFGREQFALWHETQHHAHEEEENECSCHHRAPLSRRFGAAPDPGGGRLTAIFARRTPERHERLAHVGLIEAGPTEPVLGQEGVEGCVGAAHESQMRAKAAERRARGTEHQSVAGRPVEHGSYHQPARSRSGWNTGVSRSSSRANMTVPMNSTAATIPRPRRSIQTLYITPGAFRGRPGPVVAPLISSRGWLAWFPVAFQVALPVALRYACL